MAKEKKRTSDHLKKHVLSQEAVYVMAGLGLFIFSIIGLISQSGIVGNFIRFVLLYVIGSLYLIPLAILATFGLYLFFMRSKPKLKLGIMSVFLILLIVFSAILLSAMDTTVIDVFSYYNELFDELKGPGFYIDRTGVSILGGGLLGHVIYYSFVKLFGEIGIRIICIMVIVASLYVLLKPIIYRIVRFISRYVTKSGIFERIKERKEKEAGDIPPEFDVKDPIISPKVENAIILETTQIKTEDVLKEAVVEPIRATKENKTIVWDDLKLKGKPQESESKNPTGNTGTIEAQVTDQTKINSSEQTSKTSILNHGIEPIVSEPIPTRVGTIPQTTMPNPNLGNQPSYHQSYQQPYQQYQNPYPQPQPMQQGYQPVGPGYQTPMNPPYQQQGRARRRPTYYQEPNQQASYQGYPSQPNPVYPANGVMQTEAGYIPFPNVVNQPYPVQNPYQQQGTMYPNQQNPYMQPQAQVPVYPNQQSYQPTPVKAEPVPTPVNTASKASSFIPKIEIEEVDAVRESKQPLPPFIEEPKLKHQDISYEENEVTHIDLNASEPQTKKSGFQYDSFVMKKSNNEQTHTVAQMEVKKEQTVKKEEIYQLPPVYLLKESSTKDNYENSEYLKEKVLQLNEKLSELKVKAEVVDYKIGPTVTRIEVKPDPGVKVAQVNSIKDDLMMGMAVNKMRMESPIPGKSAIGIEIPNQKRTIVRLKEILAAQPFNNEKLTISLGKDVDGNAINVNVNKMPHLLIAGGSGSGKSVCVNTIILSLLMRYTPEDLRLILVDLKQVELNSYSDIPHLVCPIINTPKESIVVLNKLVNEMAKRYDLLKEAGAKDIMSYNKQATMNHFEKMPYIVLIIDELADLMATSAKEVENSVQRLSQLARAAGIHLIFATQRPSVDVIIGVIKVNFLSRIAFKVFSQVDSKTIIERAGAEDLLGDGDMLYSSNGVITRIQGAYVDDSEIEEVVGFVKSQGGADYFEDFLHLETEEKTGVNVLSTSFDNSDDDTLYDRIVEYLSHKRNGKATTSEFQRKFAIGFGRAGRMMDRLEENGIVSEANGTSARQILITYVPHGGEEEEEDA